MEETKKTATNFINTIFKEDASIGVVNYEDSVEQLSDFYVDKNHLTEIVADISDGGETNIESGLAEAKSMLDSSSAKKKSYPDCDVSIIEELVDSDITVTAEQDGKLVNWDLNVTMSKENGSWKLLYIE